MYICIYIYIYIIYIYIYIHIYMMYIDTYIVLLLLSYDKMCDTKHKISKKYLVAIIIKITFRHHDNLHILFLYLVVTLIENKCVVSS